MSAPPFKVKAVHDYSSPHEDDLTFTTGEIITVTEEEDAEWYVGQYTDPAGVQQSGLFPRNFVERYEPAAPPRPTRSRPKKEAAPDAAEETPVAAAVTSEPPPPPPVSSASKPSQHAEQAPPVPAMTSPIPEIPPEPKLEPVKPAAVKAPPPVSEKPSSFKDRIAAFNKPAAPPIAPKPTGAPGGQGFIKKPFVAPPPSRNAYIPVAREQAPVPRTYKREEDPEIVEEQARAQKDAEEAGLAGSGAGAAAEGEEAPKATSLKERIALLQKQQQEQAARRAEVGSKAKGAAKAESAHSETVSSPPVETLEESLHRSSTDVSREVPKPAIGRTRSKDTQATPQIPSDGNEADQSGAGETTEDAAEDESTEVDEPGEKPPPRPVLPTRDSVASAGRRGAPEQTFVSSQPKAEKSKDEADEAEERDEDGEVVDEEEEEEDEEEEMDPEVRRKMELRERMAKMSGGMGMPGMFAPMGMPLPGSSTTRKSKPVKSSTEDEDTPQSPPVPQRAPLPPISSAISPIAGEEGNDLDSTAAATEKEASVKRSSRVVEPDSAQNLERGVPPPIPTAQTPGTDARGLPPAPPPRPSDPVAKEAEAREALDHGESLPVRSAPPPIPGAVPLPPRPEGPRSPPVPDRRRESYTNLQSPPDLPPSSPEQRQLGRPPPIPGTSPAIPPLLSESEARPPPPPPPTAAPPSRRSTDQIREDSSEEESEYEGDYDTDIAPGAAHKDALKSHNRSLSGDETLSEGPSSPLQRPAPPPPPHMPPRMSQRPADIPNSAPPPPPPPHEDPSDSKQADYDPYRYSGVPAAAANVAAQNDVQEPSDPSLYERPTPAMPREQPQTLAPQSPPPRVHAVPPPLPPQHQELPPQVEPPAARSSLETPRRSMEPRASFGQTRRSAEHGHPVDQGIVARDVDLGAPSLWWTQPNTIPPVFASRGDILYEIDESSSSKRGGRTTVSRDIYILFHDYSQTVVSARFDPKVPSEAQLEQRHEPPPMPPSQDALEQAHGQFAGNIVATASQLVNAAAVEGGTAQGLVRKCVTSALGALAPVGTRAYGSLIYANLGNASVAQHDEIRPGDIVSFRQARFQGKHGPMHTKYSLDIAGEHAAIVSEWDGTKKKVRAWEQGRPDTAGKVSPRDKVHVESFKLGDLRSGEVKVWRVMGRAWVGWEGGEAP